MYSGKTPFLKQYINFDNEMFLVTFQQNNYDMTPFLTNQDNISTIFVFLSLHFIHSGYLRRKIPGDYLQELN